MAAELDAQRHGDLDVEAGERLVEQQQRRVGREGPGDGDPLRLAAGELRRLALGEVADAEAVEPLLGQCVRLRTRHPPRPRPEADVGQGGQVREQPLALEDHADAAVARRETKQVDAVEPGVPLGGRQSGERPDQRGLAGAVGPDHGAHRTGPDGEGGAHPVGDREVDLEAPAGRRGLTHGVTSQRSRSASRTTIETTSITRLRASAASWSDWRVT